MMKIRKTNLNWNTIEMSKMDLRRLVEHFARSNQANGLSDHTVRWYTEMLVTYVKFLLAAGKVTCPQ